MTDVEQLKIEMLRKGVTQKMIAEHLNITKQSVYRKVNGINEWKGSEIDKVCNLLNLDISQRMSIFFG